MICAYAPKKWEMMIGYNASSRSEELGNGRTLYDNTISLVSLGRP